MAFTSDDAIDWYDAFALSQKRTAVPPSARLQSYGAFVWPWSVPYYSPLNPVFLFDLQDLKFLKKKKVWMSRDGLAPLSSFFERHPDPGSFSGKVFFHHEFESYIPNKWKRVAGTYNVITLPRAHEEKKNKPPSFLVFTVFLNEAFFSLQHFDLELKKIAAFEKNRKKPYEKVIVFFFGSSKNDEHQFKLKCISSLYKTFGDRLEFDKWFEFAKAGDALVNYDAVEINEKLLLADSSVLHTLLRNGASILDLGVPQHDNISVAPIIELSGYHGVQLNENLPNKKPKQVKPKSFSFWPLP